MLLFGYQKIGTELENSELENKINKLSYPGWRKDYATLDTPLARVYYNSQQLERYHGKVIQSPGYTAIGRVLDDSGDSCSSRKPLPPPINIYKLMSNYWGDFLVFGSEKDEFSLSRSHFSQTPLYLVCKNSRCFFSTKLKVIEQIFNLSVNEDYFSTYLLRGDHLTLETPIESVSELAAGCKVLTLRSGELKKYFYTLKGFENQNSSLNAQERQEELDCTFFNVIKNYTEPYDDIYLEFSGGLDSTALLFYLRKVGKYPKLINYFHKKVGASNELEEATKIADTVGSTILPFDSQQAMPFSDSEFNLKLLDKPTKRLLYRRQDEIRNQMIGKENSLLMSGTGGDELFLSAPVVASLSDAFLDRKFSLIFQKMMELSNFYTNANFYRLTNLFLKDLCSHYSPFKKNYSVPNMSIPDWMSKNIIQSFKSYRHLYETILNYKPGKLLQLRGLYDSLAGVPTNLEGGTPMFCPMLTKPMICYMENIPTYDLYDEEYNRILLRSTLAKKFNSARVWRQYKGQTTGVFQLGLRQNKLRVLEILRNGFLVNNKAVEFDGVQSSIDSLCGGNFKDLWSIVHIYTLELYLENWRKSTAMDVLESQNYQ